MTVAMLVALPQLIAAGLATEQQVAALIKQFHPGLAPAEQDAILLLIVADADKRIAISQKDAGTQVPAR